jgi:hypothetical protein
MGVDLDDLGFVHDARRVLRGDLDRRGHTDSHFCGDAGRNPDAGHSGRAKAHRASGS